MADQTTPTVLIRTKLHRPPVAVDHLHRQHLLDRLNHRRHRPLTLISAPAGYGKTTLASCWLESCASPTGWVSLDKNDNDLRMFLLYFIAATETLFSGACLNTQALLAVPDLPPTAALASSLLNELDRIEQPYIMVLDDYHLIKESVVHNLLAEILKHPPRSLHLVIVGRRDPPLPISRLRAQGLVTEIRTQALRFNEMEIATFLARLLGAQVDSVTAAALEKKTEGWVTGLRLAALSMRHRGNLDPKLLEPHVDAQYVMEYLFTEVFSQQPPEIIRYLLDTAILDRFCGPLCEAVCRPGVEPFPCELGGSEFIAWLQKENMFLIPLDAENRWFRFHHLYRRLLFNQLKLHYSSEHINALHKQASAWFVEEGLIEEALEHALAAGDIPKAIQLVAQHGHRLMDDQQWPRLERWLDKLPRDSVEENPEMLLFRVWLNHTRTAGFALSALMTQLEKIENLISTSPPNLSIKAEEIRAHCNALRSFQHYVAAEGEIALKLAREACKNIPIYHKRARLRAHIFQVGSYQMVGELETGLSIYLNEVKNNTNLTIGDQAMYLANLCFIYWIDADLTAMLQTGENTLKIAMDQRIPEAIAFNLYFMGIACYQQNNLRSAEKKLARLINDFYMYMQLLHSHGSFCLSLIYQAQGQPDKASERNRKMMEYAIDTGNQRMLQITRAFEAELAVRQGRLAEASNLVKRFQPKPFLPPFAFYMPQLTLVKILLAQDTTDSRRQAADLLDELHDFVTSIHNNRFRIDVLALQALLHDTLGEESVALEKAVKALALAEPGGFIRAFVDLGPQMADLLKRLASQNVAVRYIGQILAAFSTDKGRAAVGASDHPVAHPSHMSLHALVEPLTNRELEILELLAQRLRNKEIAAKLFISEETVKKHLNNTFMKFNVTSRRQAVDKALALGILSRS
jgi:LuxR family maltose regulon positive regulatory protein